MFADLWKEARIPDSKKQANRLLKEYLLTLMRFEGSQAEKDKLWKLWKEIARNTHEIVFLMEYVADLEEQLAGTEGDVGDVARQWLTAPEGYLTETGDLNPYLPEEEEEEEEEEDEDEDEEEDDG